jgi:YEATS domain-containing protein 4
MLAAPAPTKSIDFAPIVYGSVAVGLGKTEDGTTHRWTIYVRGVNGKDLSCVLAKVVFKLHPTCNIPVVECTQHPFETTQPGWGEFPAVIEVTFKDEKHSMVSFTHHLRLHPTGVITPTIKPVVHETYEEIVFGNPSVEFVEKLRLLHSSQYVPPPHILSTHWKSFSDHEDLLSIQKAHAFVKQELETAVREYSRVELELSSRQPKIEGNPADAKIREESPAAKRVKTEAAS